MIYESDETRIDKSDFVLSYHYYKTESTQSQTPESELCSKVGCACFSYRSTCSYSSPGTNHVSKCTDDDRQSRIIKWHRGWTSQAKCEEMRQQPQTYLDLTCCYTDRCNNQPGKIIKFVDPPVPVQPHELYGQQTPQSLPISHKPHDHQTPQPLSITQKPHDHQTPRTFSIAQKSSQRDDIYGHSTPQYSSISRKSSPRYNSRTRHPTTSRLPDMYKPNEAYDQSLSSTTSLLSSSIIFFSLLFSLLIMG
jgi:hypothetical protein